jgi:hypothetical protein
MKSHNEHHLKSVQVNPISTGLFCPIFACRYSGGPIQRQNCKFTLTLHMSVRHLHVYNYQKAEPKTSSLALPLNRCLPKSVLELSILIAYVPIFL